MPLSQRATTLGCLARKMTEEAEQESAELAFDHYPIPLWAGSKEEMRRAWLIEMFANSDIAAEIFVRNLDTVERWLTSGAVPEGNSRSLKKNVPGSF